MCGDTRKITTAITIAPTSIDRMSYVCIRRIHIHIHIRISTQHHIRHSDIRTSGQRDYGTGIRRGRGERDLEREERRRGRGEKGKRKTSTPTLETRDARQRATTDDGRGGVTRARPHTHTHGRTLSGRDDVAVGIDTGDKRREEKRKKRKKERGFRGGGGVVTVSRDKRKEKEREEKRREEKKAWGEGVGRKAKLIKSEQPIAQGCRARSGGGALVRQTQTRAHRGGASWPDHCRGP